MFCYSCSLFYAFNPYKSPQKKRPSLVLGAPTAVLISFKHLPGSWLSGPWESGNTPVHTASHRSNTPGRRRRHMENTGLCYEKNIATQVHPSTTLCLSGFISHGTYSSYKKTKQKPRHQETNCDVSLVIIWSDAYRVKLTVLWQHGNVITQYILWWR